MSASVEKGLLSHRTKRSFNWRKAIIYVLSSFIAFRIISILFTSTYRPRPHVAEISRTEFSQFFGESWKNLAAALTDARPGVSSLGKFQAVDGISIENTEEPTAVTVLEPSASRLSTLRKSHKIFMQHINKRELGVIYRQGKQGIVITAGSDDLPNILVQLRLLRRTGSTLPIEIFFINDDDYDAKVCTSILSKLNAQCRVLEEQLDSAPLPLKAKSGKRRLVHANEPLHKLLALFFSSFENVLLLDPATLVFNNPDTVLREEPFLSTGLVLWPDFWASTVSSHLFTVQESSPEKHNRRDNLRTVDMGQMLFSKSQHSATLLLAIYYTFFGENLYESLLMQSSAGERGSQAIKSAARYLEASYYHVKRYVEAVGYPDQDLPLQDFHGVAMLQSFASDDYHRQPKEWQRPLFIRANNPKLHAATIMMAGVTSFGGISKPHGNGALNANGLAKIRGTPKKPHQMWEWFGAKDASNGWQDPIPERAVWEEIWRVGCQDVLTFRAWPANNDEKRQTCQEITKHRESMGWKELFKINEDKPADQGREVRAVA